MKVIIPEIRYERTYFILKWGFELSALGPTHPSLEITALAPSSPLLGRKQKMRLEKKSP